MDEQLKIQNQQQIIVEEKAKVQNRVAMIPNESFLETETTKEGKKKLTKEEVLEQKKQNALSLDEKRKEFTDQRKQELLYQAPQPYSMDQAKDYLLHLPEIDLTTDEAVVKSYQLFANMEKEFVKISSYKIAFLDGESLDPVFKVLYTALQSAIGYGKARMKVISDPLYQKMTGDEVKALREKTENLTSEEEALRKKLDDCTNAENVFLFGAKKEEAGGFLSIRIRVPENSAYVPTDEEIEDFHAELEGFLDSEVLEQDLPEDGFEFKEDEEQISEKNLHFINQDVESMNGEMEMRPEERLAVEKENRQDSGEKTFSEAEKKKAVEKILENRAVERRREELSRVEDVQDHYTLLQDSRYSDLTDSDEMTRVKMSLFSLRLAVKGQQLDSDELPMFRQYQKQCYGDMNEDRHNQSLDDSDDMTEPSFVGEVDEEEYITEASFTPEQIEETFNTAIRNCQTYIDSHGGFTLKAITRTGRERLRLVREAQERAKKELQLFREMKEQGRLDLKNGAVQNASEIYAIIHQRLDAEERILPAAKKFISNGKQRARDMAMVFSSFMVLAKEDPYRFGGLLSGEDSVTKQLLKEFASSGFFKEMGKLEAELLSSLQAQYDQFYALPVPSSYLKEGQDRYDVNLRKQYALHRISQDGNYTKLRSMDRLLDYLTEGQKKNIDKAFQDTGGGKTEEMRSLCKAGGRLYQELKAMDEAGNIAPDLFSGMVTYDRESYANQLKKGLADLVTPYEATKEMKEVYDLDLDTEYADYVEKQVDGEIMVDTEAQEKQRSFQRAYVVKRKDSLALHMKEQTDLLFLVESKEELNERFLLRTDPDYVEKRLKHENVEGHVKKVHAEEWQENESFHADDTKSATKALGYYAMSNLLGMEGLVRKLRLAPKEVGDGILMEPEGISLYDLTHKEEYKVNGQFITKMSDKAEADLAKIAVLDILCGRDPAQTELLYCKVDREKGIITDVYEAEQLSWSFAAISGKSAMRDLMQNAPQAIAKLDEKTRKRILSMGPVTLATNFGSILSRPEMDYLADRLKAIQDRIRKVEKDSVKLKNDLTSQVAKEEQRLDVQERFDMSLTEKSVLQTRINEKLRDLGNTATPQLRQVLQERISKEENALQKVYRLTLCFRRMNRVQSLNEAKDPAVTMLLENLKRDVETARQHYNTVVTKEVEKLEGISDAQDVQKYIQGNKEG